MIAVTLFVSYMWRGKIGVCCRTHQTFIVSIDAIIDPPQTSSLSYDPSIIMFAALYSTPGNLVRIVLFYKFEDYSTYLL